MLPKLSITLNGEPTTLPSDKLEDLLDSLNLQNKRYAVEINREIIPRSKHSSYLLSENDRIEIVEAVGGG
jgi:sulfur carrier protein